jgi:hypothetical protein
MKMSRSDLRSIIQWVFVGGTLSQCGLVLVYKTGPHHVYQTKPHLECPTDKNPIIQRWAGGRHLYHFRTRTHLPSRHALMSFSYFLFVVLRCYAYILLCLICELYLWNYMSDMWIIHFFGPHCQINHQLPAWKESKKSAGHGGHRHASRWCLWGRRSGIGSPGWCPWNWNHDNKHYELSTFPILQLHWRHLRAHRVLSPQCGLKAVFVCGTSILDYVHLVLDLLLFIYWFGIVTLCSGQRKIHMLCRWSL